MTKLFQCKEREKKLTIVSPHIPDTVKGSILTLSTKVNTPMGMIAILLFYTIAKDIDVWERGNTTVYIHISRRATTIFKD